MTIFNITNFGNVHGGAGDDTLNLTYNTTTNGVWLLGLTLGADGYSGVFDGKWTNDTTFTGIENFGFTDMSGGNDIIRTGAGNDTINGGAGDDELFSGAGVDVVDGGGGIDLYGADFSALTAAVAIDINAVSSTPGGGSVQNVEGFKNLTTGSGNDTIINHKTAGLDDTLATGAGDDHITLFSGGTDTVHGGTGNDRLTLIWNSVTNGVDLVGITPNAVGGYDGVFDGQWTNDTSFTGIENFDFTDMTGGNDKIHTGTGNDNLNGGDGNDTLDGGSGSDNLDGGAGTDFYGADQSALSTDVVINLNKVSTVNGGTVKNLEGFAGVTTGSGNDTIVNHKTAGLDDTLATGAGDDHITLFSGGTDTVHGGTGNDRLTLIWNSVTNGVDLVGITPNAVGGYDGVFDGQWTNDTSFTGIENFDFTDKSGGNDSIHTGAGNDRLIGGGGNDTLDGSGGDDVLNGGAGNDRLIGGTGKDVLNGGGGNDVLIGGNGRDMLKGGGGRDSLIGGGGKDVLIGGGGRDILKGGGLDDDLQGGGARDKLIGGSGNDVLHGGAGNDVLIGGAGVDTFKFSAGHDRIKDFSGDRLALDDALWNNAPLNHAQILSFASTDGIDTMFTFMGGETVTLLNYTDIAGLDAVLSVF